MNAPVMLSGRLQPRLKANATKLNKAFAASLKPPPKISVAEWAAKYRRFPDDSAYPGAWRHETAPYLYDIMEGLSTFHPSAETVIMKCAQSGGSASAENFIGYIADVAPGPTMYVQATITAGKDWLAEKLWPMIESTPKLSPRRTDGAVLPKRERNGEGTTALRIRYRKGSWMLVAGANSAATLRQHSIRFVIEDDLDQFPNDLDKQGSPETMVGKRLTTYKRLGLSKRVKISTPTNKNASKIGRAYARSDKRRYYLVCPHCQNRFDPIWTDLHWEDGHPEMAYLIAPCCSQKVRHSQKGIMSRIDGWIATIEIDGQSPPRVMTEAEFQVWRARPISNAIARGYHITGIITTFQTWADLCTEFVAALGDVNKLRGWTNLDMGDEFALKGDAPPVEDLKLLKEQDWGRDQVPWGATVFTLGCDVQGDGIYYEALGWGHGLENWSLDHGFLPGATDVPGEGAWARLEEYSKRTFVMPGGKAFGFDQICVDAGYHTDAAKAFCKRSPKRLPVFGRDGWTRPILGRGQAISFDRYKSAKGKPRKLPGDEAYLVGTYGAKLSFYGLLKTSIAYVKAHLAGERPEPIRGRMHFSRDATDDYLDMLTSETCVSVMKNGETFREWKVESGRENHWLDCRIYNRAAAEAIGLDSRSEYDWQVLQGERYASRQEGQLDLIALANQPMPVTKPIDPPAAAAENQKSNRPSDDDGFIPNLEDWL
ncbi:hypothetical protein AEAC466_17325 [Asticcacaulis sp. AC466]|uniref:phage terminase large subunit family protein n=1 Tax=Asticcacaulis sp. AC466 TaxID=1282362 RepID=UPI0003C3D357|nr:terminase gpA endonuclease subunit [Asticcacaulis sp. AC466]ESQ82384.1 hypothetical protein AEAC466_17325 [Asticcacaulis sp. AC466]